MRRWRKVHKWLGFVVAIQVLLWISGGLVMSVLPIDKVRGKHLVMPKGEIIPPNNVELSETLSLNQWQSINWHPRSNKWVIKAINFDGQTKWLEPSSGRSVEHLSETEIVNIAISRHANQVPVAAIYAMSQVPFEVGI